MTKSEREEELVKHYEAASLSSEKVDSILGAAHLARDMRKWRRVALAMAASLLLVSAMGGWLLVRNNVLRQELAKQSDNPITPVMPDTSSPENVEDQNQRSLSNPRYKFVAFRSHGDGCPACRATGELFAGIKQQMIDEPVDFEEFELQKPGQIEQSMQRISELKLTSHVAGKNETAFALLLSPSGRAIQKLNPADGLAKIQQQTLSVVQQ